MYKKGDKVIATVEGLAFGGPGIVRVDSGVDALGVARKMVIFVEGVAPGDQIELEIFSLRRNLAKGRVLKFLKYSEARVEPRCKHFGPKVITSTDGASVGEVAPFLSVPRSDGSMAPDFSVSCGGCSWQFLSYEDQLKVKENEVRSSLQRIGEIPVELLDEVMKPIMGATDPWNYRNKMEFSFVRDKFDGRLHLGLHMKGRFNDLTVITECHLYRPWIGLMLVAMRPFFEALELNEGAELQSLIFRTGTNTGETMVNLLVENCTVDFAEKFADLVCAQDFGKDKLASVVLTQIWNKKGQPKKFEEKVLWGAGVFREELRLNGADGVSPDDARILKFEVAPQAFLQPNTRQAERFYSLVGELAELSGAEKVFDVFCGTGTIGLTLASRAARVVGIELNASAIENARQNAALNNVANAEFLVGDANKILPELGNEVDLVVVDPPRAGLGTNVIKSISATAAKNTIYVSCNPSTLARDLKDFRAAGWEIDFVQAIDQFSQTYHVETVVRLKR